MQVDVTVTGAEQTAALVNRLSRRLADGTTQLKGLVDMLLEAESERFAGRGQRWKRISPRTLRKDAQERRDPRPMRVTGRLMRSLTIRGAPGQIVRVSPTTLTFGTSIFYAHFHHRGEGVPKRTLVGLTRVQRKRVVDELRDLLLTDS